MRWSATVTDIGQEGTVYAASKVFPTNIQFDLPRDTRSGLKQGQGVTFVGEIEQVSEIDTAPPMVHTYVVLNHVQIETNPQ